MLDVRVAGVILLDERSLAIRADRALNGEQYGDHRSIGQDILYLAHKVLVTRCVAARSMYGRDGREGFVGKFKGVLQNQQRKVESCQ